MRTSLKHSMLSVASAGFLVVSIAGSATASNGRDSSGRDDGNGRNGRRSASSYINPDTGAATANNDVDPGSTCFNPDRKDRQAFSPAGSAVNNVHNDACFRGRNGEMLDGPASFESRGVGFISACPDPDLTGPKVAMLTDTNADGRPDMCFQSGYQEKNIAGDEEFHARLNNNTAMAGTQYVTWCSDENRNGCRDERNKSSIRIDWSADGTATYSADDRNDDDDTTNDRYKNTDKNDRS